MDVPAGRELPKGAAVAFGDVRFDASAPDTLGVIQSSDKAIVNWATFDIADGYSVNVNQPGATSAMLARVTGATDSRIAGNLTANGQLMLINPNGIAIGAGATINTGSFTASTLDIADADFLSGNLTFRRTGKAASIVNAGAITANGGDVALLASSVVNEGVVSARLGRVAYGAGDAITLDFSGDNFLSIAVPVSHASGLTDALGRPLDALIQAGGQTRADGGQIFLSAAVVRELMLGAVKVDGDLIASTVRDTGTGAIRLGSVSIDGGDGLVQVVGQVRADGAAGLNGGDVSIRGGAVGLGGVISASGDRDGGTVEVAASNVLSLAGVVAVQGARGDGGDVSYLSAGSITENVYGFTDASGGISGGTISVVAAGDLATSGQYRANGVLGLGGRIDMTGDSVRLLSTGISARGFQRGGLVRIGGAFQGGAADRIDRPDYAAFEGRFGELSLLNSARTTFVNDGVVIDVTSLRGPGGAAIVWSNDVTTMLGALSAGGTRAGGVAEVSGKETLRYVDLARIDTGHGGALLLDPRDIVIGTVAEASSWQYAAVIGAGLRTSVPGVTGLDFSDGFGEAVALNAAGDRLAVGASRDDGFGNADNDTGSVRLFTFANSNFGGAALVGTIGRGYTGAGNLNLSADLESNDAFGVSVALNAAGNRLAVGARADAGFGNSVNGAGSVRLFTFTNNSFGGAALAGTIGRGYVGPGDLDLGAGLETSDNFGRAVALNAAGDRLAVGANGDDGSGNSLNNSGSVRLFTFTNSSFGGAALAGTIGSGYAGPGDLDLGAALGDSDQLGASVALNAAGDRLAVGAIGDDGLSNVALTSGAVHLISFANSSFGGAARTGTIGRGYNSAGDIDLGVALEAGDIFGWSLALNAAGDRLVVGSPQDNGIGNAVSLSGSVRLFTFANSSFGGGVLAGTIGRGYTGAGNLDLGTALEISDTFGSSVALNGAGDRLVVGSLGDDGFGNTLSNSGSVRLFTFADTNFGGATLLGSLGHGYAAGYSINLGDALDNFDQFGYAVALNAGGDRLAVGAQGDDGAGNAFSASGAVRLFTFANTSFGGGALAGIIGRGYTGAGNLDLGAALEASDNFGSSVALNASGNRLAVGAPGDDGFNSAAGNSGSVRLFTFTDSNFTGAALAGTIGRGYTGLGDLDLGTALEGLDQFGWSLALNATGDRLAVGANLDDGFTNVASNSGSVRLFTFTNSSFGGGALAATIGRGYTGGNNRDLGTALTSDDQFGSSVAFNGLANRLAVGAVFDDGLSDVSNNPGSVRLFTFTDSSFAGGALAATIGLGYSGGNNRDPGDLGDFDNFGTSVALNGAGDRLAVGAIGDDGFNNVISNTGSVRLFTFTNTSFAGGTLAGTFGIGYTGVNNIDLAGALDEGDFFGYSVALNQAGDRLAVGAIGDDGFANATQSAGSVRLFTFGNTSFGSGTLVGVIGRDGAGLGGVDMGAVLDNNDAFGFSLAFNAAGDRLAVGARWDSGFGNSTNQSGAVHLFTFSNSNFAGGALAGTIGRGYTGSGNIDLGGALEASDNFGAAVAFNGAGNRLAVGAPSDDGFTNAVSNSGSVRLFTFTNNSFGGGALAGTMGHGYPSGLDLASVLDGNDLFGGSVALNAAGDRLAVGATGDRGSGNSVNGAGAVRLFTFSDTNFGAVTLAATLGRGYTGTNDREYGSGILQFDLFGSAVSLNAAGDRLAVGVPSYDGPSFSFNNSGMVRLFTFSNTSFAGGAVAGSIGRGFTGVNDIDPGSGLGNADNFGTAVALNAAGDRLAVGVFGDDGLSDLDSNAGAIRLFSFANANFGGGAPAGIIGRDYTGAGDFDTTPGGLANGIGGAVAVNADFTSLAISAPTSNRVLLLKGSAGGGSVASLAYADNAAGTSNVSVTALANFLSTGQNISFEASNDITLANALTVNNPSGNGGGLTLRAGRSILLNANIVTDNGNLTLEANTGGSDLATVNANRQAGAAEITMASGVSIDAGTGTVNARLFPGTGLTTPTSGDVTLGSITAGAINVSNAGPTAGSDVILRSGAVLSASGAGRAIDIRAETGTFTNNTGAGALSLTGGGTYAVFSDAPATTLEGVNGYLKRYNVANAAAFNVLNPGGSFFAYRIAPVLTVTAANDSRVYGAANPAFTAAITGFIDGDSISNLSGAAGLSSLAGATSGVGSYDIVAALGTLASDQGYQFSFVNGTLGVTARPITITADAFSRIYGATNPSLTYVVGGQGLVNGDALTGALATTATTTSNTGAYGITQGTLAATSNYDLSFVGANLTVTPRPITITADAFSRIYGAANPSLTYVVGGQGLVNGDALTGALATAATTTSNIGAYGITQGTLAATSNYDLSFVGANLTVTARPITITADAFSRIYGAANPSLTYVVGGQGLVNGDALTGALATAATTTSNIGAYGITQGTLAATSNYDLSFVGANLTVTPRPITITADAFSRIYGAANPSLTYVVGGQGLVNGDALTGALATTATTTSNIGAYGITQGTLAATSNYDLSFVGANLTVTARPITITADAFSRIYGAANPSLTYVVGGQGLVNGDALTGALATTATTTSNIGAYGITQGTLAATSNYALSFNGANLTVTPRPIIVLADNLSKVFGAVDPLLTYRVGGAGLVNGDTLLGGLARASGENPGRYVIGVGTLAGQNYVISFVPGAFDIGVAPVTDSPAPSQVSPPPDTSSSSSGNGAGQSEPSVVTPINEAITAPMDQQPTDTGGGCPISAGGVCIQINISAGGP